MLLKLIFYKKKLDEGKCLSKPARSIKALFDKTREIGSESYKQ
jgi:hypothetical protein